MPAPLSMDLRRRIADVIEAETESYPLIAERFGVSETTVARIARLVREGHSLKPTPSPGRPTKTTATQRQWLKERIEQNPYQSSYALTDAFHQRFTDQKVHRSTILRVMRALGLSYKKNSHRSAT